MSRFFRTYEQAIEFLFGRINYERVADASAWHGDLKLDRVRRFLSLLGRPQDKLRTVHVAGTKGKGSTSVMAAEMLRSAGYKTGLFTSPHVSAFEERMTVNGSPPAAEHVVDLVNRLVEPVDKMDCESDGKGPTYFEIATAMAWLYFLDCGADIAVLEVGLGGRLDATNVCHPRVGVITNISRDHTNILGSTLAQIAREKAGIVKPGIPLISGVGPGPAGDVIDEVCRSQGSPLFRLGFEIRYCSSDPPASSSPAVANRNAGRQTIDIDAPWGAWRQISVPLLGLHQAANAALAVAAVSLLAEQGLRFPAEAFAAGLAAVRWPARIEVVGDRPTVVLDTAHNWASTEALIRTLEEHFSPRRRILVFAATQDKDVGGMLRLLLPRFHSVILTQYQNNPRGVTVDQLAAMVEATAVCPFHIAPDAGSAWRLARHLAAADDLICATGSFFIAAEIRELILDGEASAVPADRSLAPSLPRAIGGLAGQLLAGQ